MMDQKNIEMTELHFMDDQEAVKEEIGQIMSRIPDRCDKVFCEEVYSDTQRLFHGEYPGYRASNTKYHSLEHTTSVALAAARLIHGAYLAGKAFNPRNISLTFAATLFHDAGLIQDDLFHRVRLVKPSQLPEQLYSTGLIGDDLGARADWLEVTKLAPETPAAESARRNLERMDVKAE